MSTDNSYIVYKHVSPSNKVYIGITSQKPSKRWGNGYGYKKCPAFYNAINKYGWENIRHEILYSGLSKQKAEEYEILLISHYKSNDPSFGYNIENGGNVAGTHSIETKRKISIGNKGKSFTPDAIAKMRESHKGTQQGKNNSFWGHHHTDSTKKAQSEFMKGNQYFKGKHHSDEFKFIKSEQMKQKYADGNHPRARAVIHEPNDKETVRYKSLRIASIESGINLSTLFAMVHDINNNEWRYE